MASKNKKLNELFEIAKRAGKLYEDAGKERTPNPYQPSTIEYRTFERAQTPSA